MTTRIAKYIPAEGMASIRNADCPARNRAAVFAQACRINCLYMIQKAGSGHIGSSFSSLDIMSWLHLSVMGEKDIFFSSKGHDAPALYAVLTGMGRLDFDLIHTLRRLDGLPGHPDVAVEGIRTNTGSLGMGVSKAKGMVEAARLRGEDIEVFVMLGDGELQEGQIYESLQPAANRGLGEITAIVDHNKIQSDTWVEQTSPPGDIERKFGAFGWATVRCDGNDISGLDKALSRLRADNPDCPKLLLADTLKGKGVARMESFNAVADDHQYRYHSGALPYEEYLAALRELEDGLAESCAAAGLAVPAMEEGVLPMPPGQAPVQRLIGAYEKRLEELGGEEPNLVVLDADLAKDCGLLAFRKSHPDRFIECGIAEMDMASMAGGLALSGMVPVVHSFSSFLTTRANEQIFNNATEKTRIIYSGSLAGILPSGPGHSHQSVRDIALMGSVPGMVCIQPCCEAETVAALDWAVRASPGPTYIRLTSIPCRMDFELPNDYELKIGKGCVLRDGDTAVLFAYGPVMLQQAWQAARLLEDDGVDLKVVNLPWLNAVESQWLRKETAGKSAIFTLDDHHVRSGQGVMIASNCAQAGIAIPVTCLGLESIPACGQSDEVLARHGLDARSIADKVQCALS